MTEIQKKILDLYKELKVFGEFGVGFNSRYIAHRTGLTSRQVASAMCHMRSPHLIWDLAMPIGLKCPTTDIMKRRHRRLEKARRGYLYAPPGTDCSRWCMASMKCVGYRKMVEFRTKQGTWHPAHPEIQEMLDYLNE